jgi:hypothetical protein
MLGLVAAFANGWNAGANVDECDQAYTRCIAA